MYRYRILMIKPESSNILIEILDSSTISTIINHKEYIIYYKRVI